MKYILFDLDGTLLPMDQDAFVREYFKAIAAHLAPHGLEPKRLINTILKGTAAMVKNDGAAANAEVFWKCYTDEYGGRLSDEQYFDEFYRTEFDAAKSSCGLHPDAAATVKQLKKLGYKLVLASNPIFPEIAHKRRMAWAGVDPDDFILITAYENMRYCKPNPDYYRQICDLIGATPADCLMVGNDVGEDMVASTVGMKVFLLPDQIINPNNADTSSYPQGDYSALLSYVQAEFPLS